MANLIFESEIHHKSDKVNLHLNVLIFQEDGVYIAYYAPLDISAFGNSEEEAKREFELTVTQYFTYCLNKKTLAKDLKAHGWTVKSSKKFKAPSDENMLASNETYKDIRENKNYKVIEKSVTIPAVY